MMKDREEWERFTLSGKVEDYLRYAAKEYGDLRTKGEETEAYAGFAHGDGSHTESGACR